MTTIKYSETDLALLVKCPECNTPIILPFNRRDKKFNCPNTNCLEELAMEFKGLELYDINEGIINEIGKIK